MIKVEEIPKAIRLALKNDTSNSVARAFCRSNLGVALPKGIKYDAAIELIKEKGEVKTKPLPVSREFRDAPPEDTRPIDVEICEADHGTMSYTQEITWSGEMDIPVSIIEDGEDAVQDYIYDHYYDLNCDYGDIDYGDSESDMTEVNDSTYNIDQLIEDYEDEQEDEQEDE